jgi:hypothetical protein
LRRAAAKFNYQTFGESAIRVWRALARLLGF